MSRATRTDPRCDHWRVVVVVIENPIDPATVRTVIREYPEPATAEQHPANAATLKFYATCEAVRGSWGIADVTVTLEDSVDGRQWGEVKRTKYNLVDSAKACESVLNNSVRT